MARYPLYVHRDVDSWLDERGQFTRRADWLMAELAARGVAGRPKGVAGPARDVIGLPGHRWRRSGLAGFDYYAWWFAAEDTAPFPPASRVVRAIRQHDTMERLPLGDVSDYVERPFEQLAPLTEEQEAVVKTRARIRLTVGHPGTGKTGALLYSVVEEARRNSDTRLLYVTLSRGLADDARQFLEGLPDLDDRFEVATYANLLAEWSPDRLRRSGAAPITDHAEEQAFRGFVADQPRNDIGPWQRAQGALWAEVRAHLIGRALPFPFTSRGQVACAEPLLDRESYLAQRQRDLGISATTTAWRLARRFVDTQTAAMVHRPAATLHRVAWSVLERIQEGRLDGRLRPFDGLVVDEIQDLTVLQLATLVEATRRIAVLKGSTPCFIAAGDESQVVHPSGFDWGVYKDLLRERLGSDPEEFVLATNQRSPSPLVLAGNRTALLYDEIPREYRPQARVESEHTEAANGRVFVVEAASDNPILPRWLEHLRESPGSAIVVCPGVKAGDLAPLLREERFADLLYDPAVVKGLDRQYVVIWEASKVLGGMRDEVRAARNRNDRPRYLAARRTIDEFRVAVSRSNETLVFLDRGGAERDPLLEGLIADGPAEEVSLQHLDDILEARGHDPLERTIELLNEARDLRDIDLERAARTLERADAALSHVLDPTSHRLAHEQRIDARRGMADRLLAAAGQASENPETRSQAVELYRQAADHFAELVQSFQVLDQQPRVAQYELLTERYASAPPGSDQVPVLLPDVLDRYVEWLANLPQREQRAAVVRFARVWRDELASAEWRRGSYHGLQLAVEASELLAEITATEQDARAARALRGRLADLLIERKNWVEAAATLEKLAAPPPDALACCYEGLGRWEQAAQLREEAGQLEAALADYRQCGDLANAAQLASRLEQTHLAEALGVAAGLVGQLDSLEQVLTHHLSEAELQRLTQALRQAATRLAPRTGRSAERRRG